MGVRFVSLGENDTVVAIARNAERAVADEVDETDHATAGPPPRRARRDGRVAG